MWDKHDFDKVERMYMDDAETYGAKHPNKNKARTLLVSTHNLYEKQNEILSSHSDKIGAKHQLQLLYLRRGIYSLRSIFFLTKHHIYSASYGQIRFLWELYLVVRDLNRNKEKTREKWIEFKGDLSETDYGQYETLPLTKYFSGKSRQIRGDLAKKEEMYGNMYDRLSNLGSHPNSIKTAGLDGEWNEIQERDTLQFGLIFVYALAAQYIRTFEDSSVYKDVHKKLDQIIIQILLVQGYLPTFLEEDMEFGSMG